MTDVMSTQIANPFAHQLAIRPFPAFFFLLLSWSSEWKCWTYGYNHVITLLYSLNAEHFCSHQAACVWMKVKTISFCAITSAVKERKKKRVFHYPEFWLSKSSKQWANRKEKITFISFHFYWANESESGAWIFIFHWSFSGEANEKRSKASLHQCNKWCWCYVRNEATDLRWAWINTYASN